MNCYSFLETKANKAGLITSELFIPRTTSHIAKSIDTVLDLYESRGFNISDVHIDNKFNIKTLKVHLITIFTHIYVKKYNVVIIEQMIRVSYNR